MDKDEMQDDFIKVSAVIADENLKTSEVFCSYFNVNQLEETSKGLTEFVQKISSSTILVTWSKYAYTDFLELCKNSGLSINKCKIVFLKRTLSTFIKEQRSFEKVLKRTELYDYDKPLGQDTNDVKYLKEIYELFLNSYRLKENKVETQFCIAKGSNILHDKNCHHAQRAKEVCDATPEVLFEGYTYCKHCERKHALRAYALESNITHLNYKNFIEKVYELCENHSIDCNILGNTAYLNSGIAHWRIIFKNNKVSEVLHESYNAFKFNTKSPGDMKFHKQYIKENDIESVIEYIYSHDKNKPKTLSPRKKFSRMEYLFSVIESGKQPVSAYAM